MFVQFKSIEVLHVTISVPDLVKTVRRNINHLPIKPTRAEMFPNLGSNQVEIMHTITIYTQKRSCGVVIIRM